MQWLTCNSGERTYALWTPGIGDPTLLGWLTVAAYFLAAAASFFAVRNARMASFPARTRASAADELERKKQRLTARFWGLLLVMMILLGINKQLDLQSWFTEIGRNAAVCMGWYENRSRVQLAFVLAVMVLGVVGTLVLAYIFRSVLGRLLGAVLGFGVLVSFIAIRAASFHHIDAILHSGPRLNVLFELSGVTLIGIAAMRSARRSRRIYS